MSVGIIKLSAAALLPVALSVIFYLLDKKTAFGKLKPMAKQVIIGCVFGLAAIAGTEFGIPINDAQVNCRDAAVLSAGLLFGGPAGIIAGLIGGVERWFAVYWGVGTFTRTACTVSTILAGFYAALLRKHMFENKKPGWLISFAIGVVIEVFHLTMVFVTNMSTPDEAMRVVEACSLPMIIANGLSVMLCVAAISAISADRKKTVKRGARISQTVQRWLLVTVGIAFAVTTVFLYQLQSAISDRQAEDLLTLALEEITDDIKDSSNEHLLRITRNIAADIKKTDLESLVKKYDVSEISIIDKNGIITKCTNKDFLGFDMNSGEQSAAFMCLTEDTEEFVQDYGPISLSPDIKRKFAGVKTEDGFIQVGYNFDQFRRDINEQVKGLTKNRHVGSTGYIIIVNEDREIVSKPDDYPLTSASLSNEELAENVTFTANVNGEPSRCRLSVAEGYYIVSVLPESEASKLLDVAMIVNTFMEILVFAVLFGFIYLIIKKVVVDKIKDINSSLAKITGGNLDETIDVRSNAEFASLSDDINSTVDTLKHYIDEAGARIDKELEFAKTIQASVLPGRFPAFPNRKDFDIYAKMDPAREVGGDFYDFYFTRANIINILIADVSGKGIPAAMFMMRAKSELKGLTENDHSLDEVFTKGNESLCTGNDAGMFVTAWQGKINLETGLVQFANAGHNPPLVKHADGGFEYLKSRPGFILAGMEGVKYKIQETVLQPGDIIFLYTDGVTEATNADKALYGEQRLQDILNSRPFADMKELCDTVKADVDAFVGEAEQFDDITMLAFRFEGDTTPQIHFDEVRLEDIPAVTDFVNDELDKADCNMKSRIQIDVAIDEIYSNIAKFAYPGGNGPVSVKIKTDAVTKTAEITFTDEGVPYNPLTKEDPDVSLSAEDRQIGGLGIFMVRKTMDDMQYRYENDRNILTVIKKI